MEPILTRCGYRCDLCLAYKPNVAADPANQQRLSDGWHRYFGFRLPPAEICCDGCMAENPSLIDRSCPVRPCVIERGLDNCAQCPDYVCERLAGRLVVYEEVARRAGGEIPEADRACFIEPYENKRRLDALRPSAMAESSSERPASSPEQPQPRLRWWPVARMALSLLVVLAALAALLFLPAGRLDWPEAWAFIGAYGVLLVLYGLWGLLKDPGLLAERSHSGANVKPWDRAIMAAYTALFLATFVVAGLDAGRFRASSVPRPVEAAAWLGLLGAGALIFWVLASNTYLSRMARIQDDRGQAVVSSGPYRYVRHPMYLGIIVLFVCVGPALGSLWALAPGGLIGALYVVRTAKEDRMLRAELAGYEGYAAHVRYRLLLGVW